MSIPSLRVAIEADGPSHVARNKRKAASKPSSGGSGASGSEAGGSGGVAGTVQLGATRMKARHLRALGWRVVNVTFEEWDVLGSAAAREAFLRRRIAAAA